MSIKNESKKNERKINKTHIIYTALFSSFIEIKLNYDLKYLKEVLNT